jgi:hypothetical protein
LPGYFKTNVETRLAALEVFAHLAPSQTFRVSFCSGKLVEREATKPLWFLQDARRIGVSLRSGSGSESESGSEVVLPVSC